VKEDRMAESKLKPSSYPVTIFLNTIPNESIRQDCWTLFRIMTETAQAIPRMWGTDVVGFGQFRAVDMDGKEGYWMLIGFSPRKQTIALYFMIQGSEHSAELLAKLGKYTHGKGCLYIKNLADIDLNVLKELLHETVANKVKPGPGVDIYEKQ
jgi:hypothetical protein